MSLLISPTPSPVEKAEQKKKKIEILIKEEKPKKPEQHISGHMKQEIEKVKEKNNVKDVRTK